MSRPLTAEEKALERAERAAAAKEAVRIAECLKWRDVDSKKEVFLLDVVPPERHWTQFKMRKGATLHRIYRSFYTDSVIDRIGNACKREDFIMGVRHTEIKSKDGSKKQKTTTNRVMNVTKKYILQSKAIQIYLTANQEAPKQIKENAIFLKKKIDEARSYLAYATEQ